MPGTGAAGFGRGAGLSARTVARLAQRSDVDGDRLGLAVKGFLQADFHVVAQIGAALRPALTTTATAHEFAEHAFENVGKARKIVTAAEPAGAAALLERGMAEAIIRGAFLRIL